ncbi:MAG TPA: CCA tRNA nucleotidyltransferase [Chondromyces sp.]|nr:CCA tRNA nucleotidyltransferase [Chondromyces sp.]
MNNEDLFEEAAPILARIEEAGFEAFYVGGSVRDYILGRPIGDVDIATSALPEEVKKIFHKTVDVGIEHGTVLVLLNGKGYEVTTYRTESDYKDFRHPEKVMFVRTLSEDLQRRDFTMNAMAMDYKRGIIDPFHGREDLQNRQIRTVGPAEERFSEDALRMMRAARFVSQLGFSLEEKTSQALKEHAPLLRHIAVERKLNEMEKLLAGGFKKKGLHILLESDLFRFLPGLADKETALRKLIELPIESCTSEQIWLMLTFLAARENPAEFLREWRLPVKKIKSVVQRLSVLERRLEEPWTIYSLYEATLPAAVDAEQVRSVLFHDKSEIEKLQQWHEKLSITDRKQLAVTGNDLKGWAGKQAGPWIKEVLTAVEKAVVTGGIENQKDEIREWLKSCNIL